MRAHTTRRKFIRIGTIAAGVSIAGCVGDSTDEPDADDSVDEEDDTTEDDAAEDDGTEDDESAGDDDDPAEFDGYEVWALDQGTNLVYIYELVDDDESATDDEDDESATDHAAEDGPSFELVDTIDFGEYDADVPHMIDFSSDYSYAAVACTAGEKTVVLRTDDREVVDVLDTGAGSHMASFSPDDEYIHVDVIGEETIVRVDADLDEDSFEIVDEIYLPDDETVQDAGIEPAAPICHQFSQEGYTYHTLGPSYHDAGLVVVDHDDFSVVEAFDGDELPTNCGTMPHPTESKFYLTAGLPSDPDEGEDGVGAYYVLDTETNEVIEHGDTGGYDAHGFWFTPDGEELWVLNRETDDGIVLDPDTDEVVEEIDDFGPAPDIMWASPDGEYMFVSLRGPNPVSGDPHAATGETPGFNVLDIESRGIVQTVVPDGENEDSDFHGIGVRPLGDVDPDQPVSPPF